MPELIVRPEDARKAGFCLIPGARDFLTLHGFDFRRFVREGIPASELEVIDDIKVQKTIEQARARTNG